MAGFEHLGTLGFSLSTLGPTTGLSHSLHGQVFGAVACWKAVYSKFGEYNRYGKEHQAPISIDRVPVHIPPDVKNAKYTEYKHARLTGEGDEIRLLELLPAVWSKSRDFIACRLVTRMLADNPQYEAISYTWGTLARDVPIFIVPNPLPEGLKVSDALLATPQLYAALKRLRLEKSSRYLWVDQICIDQTNNKERGEQVMLMDKVYEQSKRTIVWLGEEDEHRASVEEMLGFLTTDNSSPKADAEIIKKLFIADHGVGPRRQEAIKHLLNRDWFTRAWIFQEAVLSKQILLKCGGLEVPFDLFKRLIDAVMRVQFDSGGYARSLLKTTIGFDTIDLIQHGRQPCSDQNCQRFVEIDFLGLLFEALQQFRATNPRDLIYAFLAPRFQNLQPENRIVPNYEMAVEWVWTDATRRIVADTHSLDILAAARGREQGEFKIPSWVPDWSYCFRYARPITAPGFKTAFSACRSRKHMIVDPPTGFTTLLVKGKIIRKIAWIAPLNFAMSYYRDGMGAFLDVDGHVGSLRQHLFFQRRANDQQISARWLDLKGELLRTLMADGAFGHQQPLPETTKELQRVLADEKNIVEMKQRIDSGEQVPNVKRWTMDYDLLEKLRGWGLVAQKKSMFVTKGPEEDGWLDMVNLGLAASSVQVNDVVAVLHGSKVPVALRPIEGSGRRWRVVSQCYLEGWMYDNNVVRDPWWEEEDADSFLLV